MAGAQCLASTDQCSHITLTSRFLRKEHAIRYITSTTDAKQAKESHKNHRPDSSNACLNPASVSSGATSRCLDAEVGSGGANISSTPSMSPVLLSPNSKLKQTPMTRIIANRMRIPYLAISERNTTANHEFVILNSMRIVAELTYMRRNQIREDTMQSMYSRHRR